MFHTCLQSCSTTLTINLVKSLLALLTLAGLLDTAMWSMDLSVMGRQLCSLIVLLYIQVHVSKPNLILRIATYLTYYNTIGRYWEVVEKLKINHFYTTPSVIQKLRSLDKDIPDSFDLSSLRVIASGNINCLVHI